MTICAAIATIYGCYVIIRKPFARIDDHERRIGNLEEAGTERRKTDQLILKSLNAITNHMIDGNGIEKLKDARNELQNNIIEHHR
ncbi:MAG: hypothetical protein K6D03_01285 [Solobacterium sp.]|nr:hypothetical protein [Solobacterium sp.]